MKGPKVSRVMLPAIFLLLLPSCARAPIDEIARNSIREKVNDALASYAHIVQSPDRGNRNLVGRRLNGQMPGLYSLTWSDDGRPLADIYLREHVTTSGGFFGEQWTASACVRYSYDGRSAAMKSIECPETGIQSTYTDERVTIP
ncbi:hypothetical protein [Arthrobacter celericrescens]|uniref:hypothetical protein n=1 Tax=Arthrobacter celericrescens TaxID=2320851 RepID=UPI0013C4B535|nr:hypothetical protein [Arthrobacter celericrescens]